VAAVVRIPAAAPQHAKLPSDRVVPTPHVKVPIVSPTLLRVALIVTSTLVCAPPLLLLNRRSSITNHSQYLLR
jgi:hypothetical protein